MEDILHHPEVPTYCAGWGIRHVVRSKISEETMRTPKPKLYCMEQPTGPCSDRNNPSSGDQVSKLGYV